MADLKEIGRLGLNRWGGHISEEFLPELSGIKGVRVYQEMSDNDSTVGAILFAIKMLIRQASWSVLNSISFLREKNQHVVLTCYAKYVTRS